MPGRQFTITAPTPKVIWPQEGFPCSPHQAHVKGLELARRLTAVLMYVSDVLGQTVGDTALLSKAEGGRGRGGLAERLATPSFLLPEVVVPVRPILDQPK